MAGIVVKGENQIRNSTQKDYWVKVVSQTENKQKSPTATQSMGITNLEITSLLLCLNYFYY